MTKTLADMVAELQEDVPAVSGVPSEAQYERAIKEAVSEFSRRCGLRNTATISVVAGTASYTLPDDFMELIEFESTYDEDNNVMITPAGIIAFGIDTPFEEEIVIKNGTLVISPTPAYSMDRELEYKSAWVLDEQSSYPLTDDEVRIVMLKAKQLCFDKLANADAGGGLRYTIGNMTVDKTGSAGGYTKRLYELQGEFVEACNRYNGAVMR